jgi:hypothetical protein
MEEMWPPLPDWDYEADNDDDDEMKGRKRLCNGSMLKSKAQQQRRRQAYQIDDFCVEDDCKD